MDLHAHVVHDLGQEDAVAQILERRHLHVGRQLVLEALRLHAPAVSASRLARHAKPTRTHPEQQAAQLRVVHRASPAPRCSLLAARCRRRAGDPAFPPCFAEA